MLRASRAAVLHWVALRPHRRRSGRLGPAPAARGRTGVPLPLPPTRSTARSRPTSPPRARRPQNRRETSHDRRRGHRGRPRPARARRRRPAERRQVDPGEPDPGPPRGGRAGRARGDPGPGRVRRAVVRAGGSPWSTPAAGSRTPRGCQARVAAQAEQAMRTADAVLLVVDARRRRDRRPTRRWPGCCAAAASRSCWPRTRWTTSAPSRRRPSLWSLGPGRAVPGQRAARPRLRRPARRDPRRRCRRRRRSGDDAERGPRRVALVGRPNVGKSSLLNRLTGEDRAVVDAVAGTTVDPVDSLVEIGEETWRFVDTAGLRRRVAHASGAEYYASLRTAGRDRGGRGRGRAAGRERADQRAGPAGDRRGDRGRPGAGDRVQQVGPGRRGPPAAAGQGDRPRAAAGAAGRRGSTSRPRPVAASTSSRRRCAPRWRPGSGGCRPAGSTAGWAS